MSLPSSFSVRDLADSRPLFPLPFRIPLAELIADAPKPDPETGLHDSDGKHEMKEFKVRAASTSSFHRLFSHPRSSFLLSSSSFFSRLPTPSGICTSPASRFERSTYTSSLVRSLQSDLQLTLTRVTLSFRYEPYDALRQKFWREYILTYDADSTGQISLTELQAVRPSHEAFSRSRSKLC